MKRLLVAALSLSVLITSSCASRIPYSPDEECALQGMGLRGISTGESSGSAYIYNVGTVSSSSSYYGVNCGVPKDKIEASKVNMIQSAIQPKVEYNSSFKSKWLLSGLGYYALIVPGIILKVIYDGQASDATKQTSENYRTLSTQK